jgi:hypothetical protein
MTNPKVTFFPVCFPKKYQTRFSVHRRKKCAFLDVQGLPYQQHDCVGGTVLRACAHFKPQNNS